MPSTKILMAPSIVDSDPVQGETFLPGQIFVFGGFALRANSLGHLEQIDSYAPGHQISFGNLDHVTDIRGDLIFQGFMTPTSALALGQTLRLGGFTMTARSAVKPTMTS